MSDLIASAKLRAAIEFLPSGLRLAHGEESDALQREVLSHFDESAVRLHRYVRAFGLSADVTQDIVQDAFLLLFRHLRLGRPRGNLTGWLFRVAHNQALKQRRRLARQRETLLDDSLVERLIDPAGTPEEAVAHRERYRRLRSVLRALPERDRHCLFLRAEGLPYRDIAKVLGISLGSVAKSLTRALTRLTNADVR